MVPSLVKNYPSLYRTRRWIAAFTSAHHPFLSWAISIQSMSPHHLLKIHFNIILPYTPIPSKWSICPWYPHPNSVCTSSFRWCVLPVRPFRSSWFDHPINTWCEVQNTVFFFMLSSLVPCHPSLRSPNIFLSIILSNTLSVCSSLITRVQFSNRYTHTKPRTQRQLSKGHKALLFRKPDKIANVHMSLLKDMRTVTSSWLCHLLSRLTRTTFQSVNVWCKSSRWCGRSRRSWLQ